MAGPDAPVVDSSARGPVCEFGLADAERALAACVDRTDDALWRYQRHANADGPAFIVPKLALLITVLRRTGIARVRTVHSVGSCAGLLISERYWQ